MGNLRSAVYDGRKFNSCEIKDYQMIIGTGYTLYVFIFIRNAFRVCFLILFKGFRSDLAEFFKPAVLKIGARLGIGFQKIRTVRADGRSAAASVTVFQISTFCAFRIMIYIIPHGGTNIRYIFGITEYLLQLCEAMADGKSVFRQETGEGFAKVENDRVTVVPEPLRKE